MKVRSDFPRRVRSSENEWIAVSDGTRLAARIWLPEGVDLRPVPAILEFIPYRKRDGMAVRDSVMHPYFAGHGYAAVRVDLRGSGDSEGVLDDEYCPQEQRDGLDVIAWLAAQPWCTGRVGMIGISWGGFNALQIAAEQPEALKAIITVGSTDDRYADDVHYMGGCLLSANFTWAQTFYSDLSRPPDPAIVGERWRDMWLHRLNHATFFVERWLRHQTRDAYWRHGSVGEKLSAITCAVMAVGGWADSYTNAVGRLLSGLDCPRKGLIGPWGHDYPHTALPGPAIGFLAECLRWWDHWLKDEETGIMDEPVLRAWMQEAVPAEPTHAIRGGRWIGVDEWPSRSVVERIFHLTPAQLSSDSARTEVLTHCSAQSLGAAAGEWCPYGLCADQPADQRQDDGLALCFDMACLDERIEVLGTPIIELRLAVDQSNGFVAVRLEDVDPEGRSTRVSYGLLNLTHRLGHDNPQAVDPGEPFTIRAKLCDLAYAFLPGHRIRVAISTAYWPTAWPSPRPVTLKLHTESCRLVLPQLPAATASTRPVSFAAPEGAPPETRTVLRANEQSRTLSRDYLTGVEHMVVVVDDGLERIESHGLEVGRRGEERYSIHPDDPLSARIEARWTMTLGRGAWRIRTETDAVATASEAEFLIQGSLRAFEGDSLVFDRRHEVAIPRRYV